MTPTIFFVAGCNGSGKSTFIDLTFSDLLPKIDPDLIKKQNDCSEIEAGKIAINTTKYYLKNKITFIRESTLTSNLDFKILEISKKMGYKSRLYYIEISNCNALVKRVMYRVREGGHGIPADTIIRRYQKSIDNLIKAIPLFDNVLVLDNSGSIYKNVITLKNSKVEIFDFCPIWFEKVAQQLNIPKIGQLH